MENKSADLLPGEQVRWEGRPVRHSLFRPQDGLLVPISVLIFGFSVYDEVSYFMRAADGRDSLASFGAWWGLPVALLGLYFIVGRFVVRAIVSRRTRYVLTDQRLLVIGGLSGPGPRPPICAPCVRPSSSRRPTGPATWRSVRSQASGTG